VTVVTVLLVTVVMGVAAFQQEVLVGWNGQGSALFYKASIAKLTAMMVLYVSQSFVYGYWMATLDPIGIYTWEFPSMSVIIISCCFKVFSLCTSTS